MTNYYEPEPSDEHLKELQDALNAVASDPAWRHKIIVLPSPDPPVMLKCEGTRVWLECSCGWVWVAYDGEGMTGYSLSLLRSLARHTCPNE